MIIESIILIILLLLSALFAGMTIGMFSLSMTTLEAKARLGDKKALKILPLRRNSTLLLTTLLFGNVAVNTAIPILLNSVVSGVVAGLIATFLIVIFGDLLPQAFFERYALEFGSKFVWVVRIFRIILFPVAYPVSWILDKILGKESPNLYTKQEFSEIIKHHEDAEEPVIDSDEERILLGALSFSDKEAYDIMTPRTVCYCLNKNTILNNVKIEEIKQKGYSRIPVYEGNADNIIGLIFVKDLIGIEIDEETTVEKYVKKNKFIFIEWNEKLDKVLDQMVKTHNHLAIIIDEFAIFNGIVTLEDIIEEILKVEIVDEQDKIIDLQRHAKERVRKRMS